LFGTKLLIKSLNRGHIQSPITLKKSQFTIKGIDNLPISGVYNFVEEKRKRKKANLSFQAGKSIKLQIRIKTFTMEKKVEFTKMLV